MSTLPHPLTQSPSRRPVLMPPPERCAASPVYRSDVLRPAVVRRRPSQAQGMALETLGHAIEYLVDSRLAMTAEAATAGDAEAIRILSRLSREVFSACAPVQPLSARVRGWLAGLRQRGEHLPVSVISAVRDGARTH